jgi:uracil-DNA glycosylase
MAAPQGSPQRELGWKSDPAGRLSGWTPERWPVAADWSPMVASFLASPAGVQLADFIRGRLSEGAVIYPTRPLRALELTPLHQVRVVILGQDPYHGPGQAEGLAFSVAPGVRLPPSLRNIFKELRASPTEPLPMVGSLESWARRGVLLLNTILTVEDGRPGAHARRGWELLTDALLSAVASTASPCVYLLWGAHAQAKAGLIRENAHRHGRQALVLQANHPSPLSAARPPVPFLGCGHFAQTREWLAARGITGVL